MKTGNVRHVSPWTPQGALCPPVFDRVPNSVTPTNGLLNSGPCWSLDQASIPRETGGFSASADVALTTESRIFPLAKLARQCDGTSSTRWRKYKGASNACQAGAALSMMRSTHLTVLGPLWLGRHRIVQKSRPSESGIPDPRGWFLTSSHLFRADICAWGHEHVSSRMEQKFAGCNLLALAHLLTLPPSPPFCPRPSHVAMDRGGFKEYPFLRGRLHPSCVRRCDAYGISKRCST